MLDTLLKSKSYIYIAIAVFTAIAILSIIIKIQHSTILTQESKITDLIAEVDYQKSVVKSKDSIILDQDQRMKSLVSLSQTTRDNMKESIDFQTKLCKINGKKLEAELNDLQKSFEDSSICIVYPSQCQ